jgi:hypothetical protein
MTKQVLSTAVLVMIASLSFAQLTQRQSNPSNYSTGTRPLAGDFGIFLAVDIFDAENIVNDISGDNSSGDEPLNVPNFSLVNLKYYSSNDLVFRVGLVASKAKRVESGTLFFPSASPAVAGDLLEFKTKSSKRDYAIKPGIEKHFNPSNVIDIYIGGEALIGTHIEVDETNREFSGGDLDYFKRKGSSLLYGAGAFIGMQFFIADLPLSLGIEYGIIGKGYAMKRYRIDQEANIGGVNTAETFFIRESDIADFDSGNPTQRFESLSSRTFNLDNQVRVTFSYFFTK